MVKLRNAGKEPIDYSYAITPFRDTMPTVRDAKGNQVLAAPPSQFFGFRALIKDSLKPGEEIDFGLDGKAVGSKEPLGHAVFTLVEPGRKGDPDVTRVPVTPGKYTVGYAGLLQSHP